jgi:hypothetical protein
MTGQLRVVAYGGGTQSTANLVLAAQGKIGYRTFLFANVGNDSEYPGTISYVQHVARPFAAVHGLELHELHRTRRDGSAETLFGRLTKEGSRSLPIPVRMPDTGAPGTRSCTQDFKIIVIGKWLKAHGASPENKAVVAVGISLDEVHRINARKAMPYEILAYPLVGIIDGRADPDIKFGRMRRGDCEQAILDQPLPGCMVSRLKDVLGELPAVTRQDLLDSGFTRMPRPPKSACYFCPFHRPSAWAQQRRDEPELFFAAADLEALLNRRRDELGRDHVYLTRFGKPLPEAIPEGLTDDDIYGLDDPQCDNGWCMT